ncbi:MAG: FAD-dependent oxidoreductase, partial [Pseudomonadota bacterium]
MKGTQELEKIFEGCLGKRPAPCTAACPAHVDVRGFIALIKEGRHREALELFKKDHPFPSICGRVCHHPCEEACTRRDVDFPVAIEPLHRFLADLDLRSEKPYVPEVKERKEEKIAMIGAGPASLSAAYFLAKEGYPVTVFEKLPYAGGMMAAGIPAYRLPRDVLNAEIQVLRELGVDIKTGMEVGKDITIEKLRQEGTRAIFIGIGARECRGLGIEGEDLEGVCPGVDFLLQVNQGNPVPLGDRVAVIGGGNVAMDAVRAALRTGSGHPSVLYRRSLKEMPVDEEEIGACREEGIEIHELTAPVRIIGENGRVKALECIRMTLGEPDESGRPRPIPVKGSEFVMEVDGVIPAVGQESDWACLGPECACTLSEWGTMNVDPVTYRTEDPDLFAGGDAVTGPRTVVEAIEAGKQAAVSIDRYLRGIDLKAGRERKWDDYRPETTGVTPLPRTAMKKMPVDERKGGFHEVFLGFSEKEALSEANRCLSCECRVCVGHCEFLKSYGLSPGELAEKIRTGDLSEMPEMPFSCNLCGLCHQFCPAELDVGRMCMEARETLFREGATSLPGHRFVRTNQDFAVSDAFTLALPDPAGGKCERAFFPGCSLPAYSPSLAMKAYQHLRRKLPGTGIVLGCCGKQTLGIGDRPGFEEVMEKTLGLFKSLETSEVIVAC